MRRSAIVRTAALLALGLIVTLVAGCSFGERGSGRRVTEDRGLSGFDRIELAGHGSLTVTQTGTDAVAVVTDDNIQPLVETAVSGGTLRLSLRSEVNDSTDISYDVTVASLVALTVAGAGNAVATGLQGAALAVDIAGAGDVRVAGTTDDLTVGITGAGNFQGADLAARTATVTVTGAGDLVVNASDALNATITGAGDIQYLGDPAVTQQITGAGNISRR